MKCILKGVLLLALGLICPLPGWSQEKPITEDQAGVQTQSSVQVTPAPARPPLAFGLAEDTPVRLKLTRTISSKDARADEKVDFEVLEDIKVGDVVVIQHGALAIATITEAHPKRRMGRAGKLNVNIDYVQLVSGDKASLRAVKGGSGGSHTGAMTGAMVATGILFFPAAPLFLFMHGKDITIPKGTEITAYIGADTPLDPARFSKQPADRATAGRPTLETSPLPVADLSSVVIKSTPDGAEITIDGKFVGTTPSSLQLAAGEHLVIVEKSGFISWRRTVAVTVGGAINLEATLDKIP